MNTVTLLIEAPAEDGGHQWQEITVTLGVGGCQIVNVNTEDSVSVEVISIDVTD